MLNADQLRLTLLLSFASFAFISSFPVAPYKPSFDSLAGIHVNACPIVLLTFLLNCVCLRLECNITGGLAMEFDWLAM